MAEPPVINNNSDNSDSKTTTTKTSVQNLSETESDKEILPEEGFFGNFESFLEQNSGQKQKMDELLDKDLFYKMKEFHLQREEGKPYFFHSGDSDEEMAKKVNKLKKLEKEWYLQKREAQRAEELLIRVEEDIDKELEELKEVVRHIKQKEILERKASPDNYFYLSNGRTLKSIGELRHELKSMSEDVYTKHVCEDRNDFADWVQNIFQQKDLADDMRKLSSREEMIELLYNF